MARRVLFVLIATLAGALVVHAAQRSQATKDIKVDVDLVMVNASVTDSENHSVNDLTAERFQIWEDKVEQKIQYFSTDDAPLSVGIIFDFSQSMETKIDVAKAAATTFLQMGTPEDEYFLVKFSSNASIAENFTTSISRLRNQLSFVPAAGNTAMYDAMYLGLNQVKSGRNPRKALLLITDGGDNYSRYSRRDLNELVRESDAQIYTISFGSGSASNLSEISGGRFYRASKENIEEICRKVAFDMKNQYVLGYASTNSARDGKWRKILVKTTNFAGESKLYVRAKSGYYGQY